MISDILTHTCSITHAVPVSQNAYGEEVKGGLPVTSACRFYTTNKASGRMITPTDSEFHVDSPKLLLPSSTSIVVGDTVTSTISNFTGPYRVMNVKALTDLFSSEIDHYECELEALE